MTSHPMTEQPSLFGEPTHPTEPSLELVELARALPTSVHFGTSTWTYDGWKGDVYRRSYRGPQPAKRLEEYVRYPLFGAVGIDSAFYEPPSEEVLASYARALPPGFPCVSKAWDQITVKRFSRDPRCGKAAGRSNPDFLNPDLFKHARPPPHAPVFRYHAACFVFEFQAMHGRDLPGPHPWAQELDPVLAQLPRDFRSCV